MGFIDWLFGGPRKKKNEVDEIKEDDDWRRKEEEWRRREQLWREKEEKIKKMQEKILTMEERRGKVESERKRLEAAIEKKPKRKKIIAQTDDYEDEAESEDEFSEADDDGDYDDEEPIYESEAKRGGEESDEVLDSEEVEEVPEEEDIRPHPKKVPKKDQMRDDILREHKYPGAKSTKGLPLKTPKRKPEAPPPSKAPPQQDGPAKPRAIGILPNLTFENFVVGENNRFPFVAAQSVAQAPARAYNPLFIWGDVGLGKTHLLQSIANFLIAKNPDSKVVYCSSEKFTNELIRSVETNSISEFRDKYRNIDILLIDDIQFISGKENTQEEFFHTFNELYNNSKQIVLTSDRPPSEIQALEKRLRSRFEGGLITQIKMPSEDIRVAILRAKIKEMNVYIPDEVIKHIASLMTTNVRELIGALNRVRAFSSMMGGPVTLETASKALEDIFPQMASSAVSPSPGTSTAPAQGPVQQRPAPPPPPKAPGMAVGSASDMDLIRQLEKDAGADFDLSSTINDFDIETKKMEEDLMKELKKQGVDFK